MDKKTTFRRLKGQFAVPVIAAVSAVSLAVPMTVAAQEVDVSSEAVVIAVADSDGSTDNIDEIVEKAREKGAEVELVTPEEEETLEGSDSSDTSSGNGSPDSEDGDVERDIDGDLLEEEARAGVELMEPKVEDALSKVDQSKSILVVADGYGAGAAGNVLERIAYDEGPVEKDRILGHILIGDPYRTGSASEQSAERADFSNVSSGFGDSSSTGFVDDDADDEDFDDLDDLDADSDDDALSDADRDLQEQFQAEDSEDSGVDRIGERNNGGESYDEDGTDSSGFSSGFDNDNPEYGENDGRQVVPNYREQYGENPMSNTYKPTTEKLTSALEAEREERESEEDEPSENSGGSDRGTSDNADSAGTSGDSETEDNYVADDFDPGNGSSGQDVQEDRPENPGSINGEGALGDSGNWAADSGGEVGRLSSERGLTSADGSSLVTTSGTGILGQRARGFGDLDGSTLSICSVEDGRCASSGIPSLVVDVLTGDLEKTPELAQKVLRGLVALGKLISSVDKSEAAQIGAESVKCGASIATVSVAGSAGIAAVSTGVASPAAVPAVAGAAVAAGGAAQSCGRAAESGLNMAAEIYREYRSNPDLIQAAELIALIDPDSATYQKIKSKLPVEMNSPMMEEVLRRMAKIGYALDNIRADQYMEAYAEGAGQISELNAVGIASILTTSLSLTDAIVKALFDVDETLFGSVAEGLGGAVGGSSLINMLGTQSGRMLTQVGASYPGSTMDNGQSSDSTSESTSTTDFDYANMDVGEGISAIEFASQFADDALSGA